EALGVVRELLARQTLQPGPVTGGGHAVGGGEGQPELPVGWLELRPGPRIERGAGAVDQRALADGVEDGGQLPVPGLAEHTREVDGGEVAAAVGVRGEEVRGAVAGGEVPGLRL